MWHFFRLPGLCCAQVGTLPESILLGKHAMANFLSFSENLVEGSMSPYFGVVSAVNQRGQESKGPPDVTPKSFS